MIKKRSDFRKIGYIPLLIIYALLLLINAYILRKAMLTNLFIEKSTISSIFFIIGTGGIIVNGVLQKTLIEKIETYSVALSFFAIELVRHVCLKCTFVIPTVGMTLAFLSMVLLTIHYFKVRKHKRTEKKENQTLSIIIILVIIIIIPLILIWILDVIRFSLR